MLSLDELAGEVETGAIDTVIVAFTDMQGRLLGKRLHGEYFVEEVGAGHEVEGCDYLLALDMEMEPIPGYEIASWEQGYGDFELKPDLVDAPADPLARGDGARPLRRAVARRLARAAVAAAGPPGPGRAGCRARARADARLGARVLSSPPDFPGGLGAALREPHALGPVHPRLPHPRRDLRRGPHPPDPERDARRRHQGRDVEGRGVAGAARDQLPLRGRAPHGRQPRDLQERREGDRVRERVLAHVHGEAVRVLDRELVSRARLARPRRRAGVRDRRRPLRPLPRRPDRRLRGARRLPRADDQLVQALRGRELGTDDAGVGEGQPHVRLPRRRPRPVEARGDEDPGRRREPVPRLRGDHRAPGCTGSSRSSSRRRGSKGTRTSPTRSGFRRRSETRSARSRRGPSHGTRSATRSSTTT